MKNQQAMLLCDFYKVSHRELYPDKTQLVYSSWTPRATYIPEITEVVSFGQQMFVKEFLIEYFNENFFNKQLNHIVHDYKRFITFTLGVQDPDTSHIEALHALGYLPLSIKSLPEGMVVPLRTPMLTIENTLPEFFWLTNYIETLFSAEMWHPMTSATIAHNYKKLLVKAAQETGGDIGFVDFQGHDFSFRGLEGLHAAAKSGAGHLLSFVGTDTIPAILLLEEYYNADITKELVGTSIPATEHSIQCAYGDDMEYFRRTINEVHPSGFVAIVSDGYDFWNVVGNVLPALKADIMKRDGKVVIRPDSGDPVDIICGDDTRNHSRGTTSGTMDENDLIRIGLVEALWNIFGGTVNDASYKVLDSHIGCIYGDSITRERAQRISDKLKAKGFASTNVVYGIGSYTYQYNTRDTFGFAVKSTLTKRNDIEIPICKDPKTDSGTKKSQKGAVMVFQNNCGEITWVDNRTLTAVNGYEENLLREIFRDGKLLVDESLSTIRARLKEKV